MMRYLHSQRRPDGLLVVTMDDPESRANRTSELFKAELDAVIAGISSADPAERPRGVILTSAKASFGVGGDLGEIAALARTGPAASLADSQRIKALFRRIETAGIPFAACLTGTAAGGGFELALACHARFCLDDPAIRLGLPEVTLGLSPGAGGLLRLVHMIGLDAALAPVLGGVLMPPREALARGLLDGLAPDPGALIAAAAAFLLAHPDLRRPWDRRGHAVPGGGAYADPGRALRLQAETARLAAAGRDGRAALDTLDAMVEITACGFADGGLVESRCFARRAADPLSRAAISLTFTDRRALRRAPARPAGIPAAAPPRIAAVTGAGTMGAAIAYTFALKGASVLLADIDRAAAERGVAAVAAIGARAVRHGALAAGDLPALLGRIAPIDGLEPLESADIAVEAVFEEAALKRDVLSRLEAMLRPEALLATSTAALSVDGVAEGLAVPSRLVGLHVVSPVGPGNLVEIVRGRRSAAAALARAYDAAAFLGKAAIQVRDRHGFFAGRVLRAFVDEAAAMVGEGVAPALVENAALQAGYPVAPLALIDDAFLSLAAQGIALAPRGEHPGERVVRELLAEGRTGRRTGAGFYDHDGEARRLWPGLSCYRRASDLTLAEAGERFLFAQVAEVLRAVRDGVIGSTAEINVGAVEATGFPRWTGGPITYLDLIGQEVGLVRARALAARHGRRFAWPVADAADLAALLAPLHSPETRPAA